jgi:hypothetical protein
MRRWLEHGDKLRLGDSVVASIDNPYADLLARKGSIDVDRLALDFRVRLAGEGDIGKLDFEGFRTLR